MKTCKICKKSYNKKDFSKIKDFLVYDSMADDSWMMGDDCDDDCDDDCGDDVCNGCYDQYIERIKLNHVKNNKKKFMKVSELIKKLGMLDQNARISVNVGRSNSYDGGDAEHYFDFCKPEPDFFTDHKGVKYYRFKV